jgi:Holliday junction DNA helicase RuvB
VQKLLEYIDQFNNEGKVFQWTKPAETIFRSLSYPTRHQGAAAQCPRCCFLSSMHAARKGNVQLAGRPVKDLKAVLARTGRILGIGVTDDGAAELAKRARGTPRIVNRLLRRTRDFAEVKGKGTIDAEIARRSLEMLRIDERGLDELDRAVLVALVDKFAGGPVGLDTLAAALSEERDTITDIVEPFLLQEGLIQRTPQGRIATERALAYLGQERPDRLF